MNSWLVNIRRGIGGMLVLVLAVAFCGCDSGGKTTEYKPLEGNILKKLGKASQDQSNASDANKAARGKRKR